MSRTYIAVATLIGTIIGAGILGIPYVASLSGFPIAFFHMVLIAVMLIIIMLYLGEIGLRTEKTHQLTGYASLYLGKRGEKLMFIAIAFEVYSAVLAYLTGIGESLSFLIYNDITHALSLGIFFWVFMSILCYFGLKALSRGEELGVSIIIILIISIIVITFNKVEISNLTYINTNNFFMPFGVILFAFLGFVAVPEMQRILKKDKDKTKKVIITANIVVLIIYALFTLVVLGARGLSTPEIATLALGKIFIILGIFTMFTSYLALSIALTDALKFDYNVKRFNAWLITVIPPILIFILLQFYNINSFTKILGIGGVLSGGLTAILIIFMFKNAKTLGKRKPEYSIPYSSILSWILIAIFVIGATMVILKTI